MKQTSKVQSKDNKASNKALVNKNLVIQDYKSRLKDNVKSINDNFVQILNASKVIITDYITITLPIFPPFFCR